MFAASNPSCEKKCETELDNIAILKELKLFFINNKHQDSESQNCPRYNSILKAYNAALVYVEDEKIHKLFVNDESLEPQGAIQMLTTILESLEALNAQNTGGSPGISSSMHHSSAAAGRDVITIAGDVTTGGSLYIGGKHKHKYYDRSILDESALNAKEAQVLAQLKASYSTSEYTAIPGIFGPPLKLEGQYINLQILCTDLKTKKPEEDKESKESTEAKPSEKYKDARMASVEDLFGDKRAIKAEDLFKPTRELFNNQVLEAKDSNEAPRLLLVQGRAGIGKTTFVRYAAHQWSKGQLYTNYVWVFTLTLRKLRLLPQTTELNLSEWIRQSQFSDWSPKEFDELWQHRIKSAIHQNKVLLILDGYDETPETHPCQSILRNLLAGSGRYAELALLITTRPCGAQDISEKRLNLEIVGFADENINQYIQTYFSKVPNKTLVNTLTEALRKQPIIWANAHIPLNLNLLCGIMEEAVQKAHIEGLTQGLAQLFSITRLYQVMEKKLYERSHSRHDSGSLKIGRQLIRGKTDFVKNYQKERLFLAKLAFQGFEAERIIIPLQTIGDALETHVDKEVTQSSQRNMQQEKERLAEVFFNEVCKLGLIKPVLDKSNLPQIEQDYEFLHLTFQEYYTAVYLAAEFSSQELETRNFAEKIISKEKYNPRWQIVWWFVAGLLREKTPIYESYLQQLQGQYKGQTLTQDIFEHYQLGLLTRCIDEGFESNNQQIIGTIVQQLQLNFSKLYQTAKNITNNDGDVLKNLGFINSPFFSACRISPNLCMCGKQDFYALIPEPKQAEDKEFLSAWIGTIRVVTPKVLERLCGLLSDKKWSVRNSAAKALGELGELDESYKVLDVLLGLLSDKDKDVRRTTADALGKLGQAAATPQVVDVFLGLLSDESDDVRRYAAKALGNLGVSTVTPKVLDGLVGRLLDGDQYVCSSAAKALGKLSGAAATPKVLDTLLERLSDKDWSVRSSAAEALGNLGASAAVPEVLDALIGLMSHERREVRSAAAEVLGNLGKAAATPKVLDAIARLLADTGSDRGWGVSGYAAKALGKLGWTAVTPKVVERLLGLLSDTDNHVRVLAAGALGNLGEAAATPKVLDALLVLIADKRKIAICALGNLGEAAATPKVLDALLKQSVNICGRWSDERCSFAEALGKLGAAAAIPKLLEALLKLLADEKDDYEASDVSISAEDALIKLGVAAATPEVIDTLVGLLTNVNIDIHVRSSAAEVLGNLGGAAATPRVLDTLLQNRPKDYIYRRKPLYKLSEVAAPAVFLDWLLGISSAWYSFYSKTILDCFEIRIETVFTQLPSFWSKHANHPNILVFVSYALGAAYMNSHITCEIDFAKEGASSGYCMRGVAGKSRYCFLVSEEQAKSLVQLSSLVIEQLSQTGELDIASLGKCLSQYKSMPFVENLSPGKKEDSTLSQGSPILTQYQQSSGDADEARVKGNHGEIKSLCRII